jgi:hypothetical protein
MERTQTASRLNTPMRSSRGVIEVANRDEDYQPAASQT